MIRLLPVYERFQIDPGETPESLRQKLMKIWGLNITLDLIETSNDRHLPQDEILIDQREYYMVVGYDLPIPA